MLLVVMNNFLFPPTHSSLCRKGKRAKKSPDAEQTGRAMAAHAGTPAAYYPRRDSSIRYGC